ncbi:MAG: hypothetical protein MRJ68_03980 [Nitrospira sp.]|nr:hypothetical protein [Nitrospira sp.]
MKDHWEGLSPRKAVLDVIVKNMDQSFAVLSTDRHDPRPQFRSAHIDDL